MSDFYVFSYVKKTRKRHECAWCGEWIEAGSSACVFSGIWEGYWYKRYDHDECHEASGRDKDLDWQDPRMPGECRRGKTWAETEEERDKEREEELSDKEDACEEEVKK